MLRSIFYARFHPERGPSIVHQYPANSIVTSNADNAEETLLNFSEISAYIIPPYEACNRQGLSIVSADTKYRILGVPISLESAKYSRNRFTFNVCFVLDVQVDVRPWTRIVRKTARFFRCLEEFDGLLQAEERLPGLRWAGEAGYPAFKVGVVYPLLRTVMDELNGYGETSATADRDGVHVLNLRLVSPQRTTASVKTWHVPLIIRSWSSDGQWTCDPILQRISSHIDGIQSVKRIAERADVEVKLVKKALRELLHHERILLVDMFHSQSVYTPTHDFASFVHDEDMLEECAKWISTSHPPPSHTTITNLYRQLGPGVRVQDFCQTFGAELSGIDIRRFVLFGVLKGFLQRMHKYALTVESQPSTPKITNGSAPTKTPPNTLSPEKAWKVAALSSGWPNPHLVEPMASVSEAAEANGEEHALTGFLDGKHCLDQICLAMHMGEKKVVETLRSVRHGEVLFITK